MPRARLSKDLDDAGPEFGLGRRSSHQGVCVCGSMYVQEAIRSGLSCSADGVSYRQSFIRRRPWAISLVMATTPTVVGLPHVSSDPYTRNNEVVKLVPSGYEVTKALGGPPASPTSTAPLSEASDSRPPSPKALVLGANVTPSGVEATAPAPGSEGCGCGVGNKEMVGATSAEVPSCKQPAIRVRKIYGRLPKFRYVSIFML